MALTDTAAITSYLTIYLRTPATVNVDPDGAIIATFNPVLSAPEQATFDQGLSRPRRSRGSSRSSSSSGPSGSGRWRHGTR